MGCLGKRESLWVWGLFGEDLGSFSSPSVCEPLSNSPLHTPALFSLRVTLLTWLIQQEPRRWGRGRETVCAWKSTKLLPQL